MSAKTEALRRDPNFIAAIRSKESLRSISVREGVSYGFVQDCRANGLEDPIAPPKEGEIETEQDSTGRKTSVSIRHRPIDMEDAREWLRKSGDDPDDFNIAVKSIAYGQGQHSNKMSAWPKVKRGDKGPGPAWPVIQPPAPIHVLPPAVEVKPIARDPRYKLSVKGADTQIGFRRLADGSLDPFHDEEAMALFIEACRLLQPDKIQILGDFLDMSEQGRFAQEKAFAGTTQLAFDAGYRFLAQLRAACPDAEIIIIEGNHDKRLQNFVEANALAAFGLKRADMPESWPVMSLPFLLRLDDLDIKYIEAYPAATDWDNDQTRNIHGTRANSNGSTMAQYLNDLPHINTWAGHTHRAEVVYKRVMGLRGEAIESYAANPGCLCRTDGGVPSVKGAINSSGIPAKVVEDWQAGFGILYYNETESIPQVFRIQDGAVMVGTTLISVR